MKTGPFKAGDKVIGKVGCKTIDCVAEVKFSLDPKGEKPGSKLCYLTLVGKANPAGFPEGWPSVCFSLIWSGDKATR
jgi:hypothetical protein